MEVLFGMRWMQGLIFIAVVIGIIKIVLFIKKCNKEKKCDCTDGECDSKDENPKKCTCNGGKCNCKKP